MQETKFNQNQSDEVENILKNTMPAKYSINEE